MARNTRKKRASRKASERRAGDGKAAPLPPVVMTAEAESKPDRKNRFSWPEMSIQPVRLPGAWLLASMAALTLWRHKRLFVGIIAVYGLLNLILVQGLASSTDIKNLKSSLDQVFKGNFGSLASGLSIFVVLVGSAGNGSSQTAGAYQLFLTLLASLAVVWALRQVLAGSVVRVRDAYYRGMYPLVPFVLVLLVIGLQLLPMLIGAALYGSVVSGGIATDTLEKVICALVSAALALSSLYMISSSLVALYIVTLPDMTPRRALRSARDLLRHRRWRVLLKVLFMPLALLVIAGVIMVPIIIWVTVLSQWVFFVLTMLALAAAHAYMYTLYRELLNEA